MKPIRAHRAKRTPMTANNNARAPPDSDCANMPAAPLFSDEPEVVVEESAVPDGDEELVVDTVLYCVRMMLAASSATPYVGAINCK